MFFFFSSRRRHTRLQGDWSSDVCSSDLERGPEEEEYDVGAEAHALHDRAGDQRRRDDREHRSEEHTSELQSPCNLVCRLLLEKKKKKIIYHCLLRQDRIPRNTQSDGA